MERNTNTPQQEKTTYAKGLSPEEVAILDGIAERQKANKEATESALAKTAVNTEYRVSPDGVIMTGKDYAELQDQNTDHTLTSRV